MCLAPFVPRYDVVLMSEETSFGRSVGILAGRRLNSYYRVIPFQNVRANRYNRSFGREIRLY